MTKSVGFMRLVAVISRAETDGPIELDGGEAGCYRPEEAADIDPNSEAAVS